MIIDGKKIASDMISELKKQPYPKKFLGAVLVGENSASASFLKIKEKTAKELNISFRLCEFSENIKQDELRNEVLKIAKHKTCGGVIVQLPLPEHIDKHRILNAIPPEKDVDVLSERSLGAFYTGRNFVLPPAVGVLQKILLTTHYSLLTSKVAIIGRGFLIGKPIVLWLQDKVAELAIFASKTENLKSKLKNFDIIISGVGKSNLFGVEDIKENALVIDFGYSKNETGKLVGDFGNSKIENWKLKIENLELVYTPVPGGTGPILVAQLFEHFYQLNTKPSK